ncbi:MAG: type IV secretory system conjugative DNA transfer family protein [Gammaproteobacteria bacterium]
MEQLKHERHLWLAYSSECRLASKEGPTPVQEICIGKETTSPYSPFSLPLSERRRHLYICGKPGTGKSTLIQNLVLQDIASGIGCCVIDPHGDLVDDVLASIPAQQTARVVVFDPSLSKRPIGINLLNAKNEIEQDSVVQFFLHLFETLYLREHQGPMFFQAIRNGLVLLMDAGGTLAELPMLFFDKDFRKTCLAKARDPLVKRYWEQLFEKQGNLGNSDYLAYFTSKISHFIDDRTLRVVLSQKKGLEVSKIVKEGYVLLCDLSQGKIGQLNSRLLGMLILHLLERETLRRAQVRIDPNSLDRDRPLFNIYVDEFHEFFALELNHILSSARKYNVGVTLATQHPDQIGATCIESILANVAAHVVFRQGLPGAELLAELMQPRFSSQDLLSLPDFEAIIKITSGGTFNAPRRIVLLPKPRPLTPEHQNRLRSESSKRYGRNRRTIERELVRRVTLSSEIGNENERKKSTSQTVTESEK